MNRAAGGAARGAAVVLPAGVWCGSRSHGGPAPGGGYAAVAASGEPPPLPEAHAATDRKGAAPPTGPLEWGSRGARPKGENGVVAGVRMEAAGPTGQEG